jgi:hypothetical protein
MPTRRDVPSTKQADAHGQIVRGIEDFIRTQRGNPIDLSDADRDIARHIAAGVVWLLAVPGDGLALQTIIERRLALRWEQAAEGARQELFHDYTLGDELLMERFLLEMQMGHKPERLASDILGDLRDAMTGRAR